MVDRQRMRGVFAVVAAIVAASGGCGKSPPSGGTPAGGKPSGGTKASQPIATAPASKPAAMAWLVAVRETHSDTFAHRLAEIDAEPPGEAPFELVGRRIVVHRARPSEAALESAPLTLGDPNTPVDRCRLLVIHSTTYTGKGRHGRELAYYAFAAPAGVLALPPGHEGGLFEHDPAEGEADLALAVQSIRVLGPEAKALRLAVDEAGKLTATLGDRSQTAPPGREVVLSDRKAAIRVREKALVAAASAADENDPLETRPKAAPAGAKPTELSPAVDHGEVTFGTRLSVRLIGQFPLGVAPTTQPEGL